MCNMLEVLVVCWLSVCCSIVCICVVILVGLNGLIM